MQRVSRPWTIALAVALLVGTVAAFTYTEKLKLEHGPVGKVHVQRWLSPGCGCPHETAAIRFKLRQADTLDVTVVNAAGEAVRTLASGVEQRPGRVALDWDGRDDAGEVVPDGAYRVRVRLAEEGRTVTSTRRVSVDTRPPHATMLGVSPTTVAPGEIIQIRYRADEVARPVLLVDGAEAVRRGLRQPGARTLAWRGLVDGRPLEPGTYELAIVAEDGAGHASAPAEAVTITVARG